MDRKRIYISSIQKRMFFLSFLTSFVAVFTQTLAVLIDRVVVCAFYGETEVAAVSLAGPFFYLQEIPAAGLAAGLQTVFAKELGSGQTDRVNRQFSQIFFSTLGLLAVLTVLAFSGIRGMAVLFGARGNTAALRPFAEEYLYGLSFEIIPYVLFCILTPVVILDNGSRLVSIASVCGCITDIVLDLCSVLFGWGLRGIGLATSASAAVYFLITMTHFLNPDRVIRLRFVRFRYRELKDIFVSSGPKAFLSLADTLRSFLFISLVSITGGVTGTFALSVHGTVTYGVMILAKGIAGAVGIMTGISYGEINGEDLEGIGTLTQRYAMALSAGAMIILGLCVRPLAKALAESSASEELLMFALFCVVFTIPLYMLVHARISYMQATEHMKEAKWIGLTANLIYLIIAAGILTVPFGVRGVFLAFPVSQAAVLLTSWLLHRKKTGKRFPTLEGYLDVGEGFIPQPGDVISYPVRSLEECALAGEQVSLFCRGHGMEDRKSTLAGLCTEELATNALEHSIRGSRTIQNADIRVVIDGGDVVIRLRNGGSPFNLARFGDRMAREESPGSRPGVRILLHAAKDVSYYRTYGMNTTIIRI